MKKICIYLLLLFSTVSFGQVNLVPNPSFEDTVACPTTANQIDKAVGWHASRESPDYFNKCDFITGTTSVPANFCGYQYAHSGDAYCGFIAYSKSGPNSREYFTCHLLSPLIIGAKYFVSYYLSWAGTLSRQIACNKTGTLFSNINYSLAHTAPTSNYCQFYSDSLISDSLEWVNVQGSFVADSNYSFLTIGNFFNDSLTDTTMYTPFTSHAYYYIDDISVIQDTSTIITELNVESTVQIYPNPVSDILKITPTGCPISEIELRNLQGKIILRVTNNVIYQPTFLNLTDYSSAVYYLKITYKNNNSTYHKLLKL